MRSERFELPWKAIIMDMRRDEIQRGWGRPEPCAHDPAQRTRLRSDRLSFTATPSSPVHASDPARQGIKGGVARIVKMSARKKMSAKKGDGKLPASGGREGVEFGASATLRLFPLGRAASLSAAGGERRDPAAAGIDTSRFYSSAYN